MRNVISPFIAQKIKFFIKDLFRKYNQIRRKVRVWSHSLMNSLMQNFIFCWAILTKFTDETILENLTIFCLFRFFSDFIEYRLIPENDVAGIYLFEINNGNIKAMCRIYPKLSLKARSSSGIFIVNLDRFHTLPWRFHYWLWRRKHRLGIQ